MRQFAALPISSDEFPSRSPQGSGNVSYFVTSPPMRFAKIVVATILLGLYAGTSPVQARTIILDASACKRIAYLSEVAPRHSWAMYERRPGMYDTGAVGLVPNRGLLIEFPFEKIPSGQRIAHAELVVHVATYGGSEPRFYLWRMINDWGAGACWQYRTTWPKPVAWTKPGGRGQSSDRATRPTAIQRLIHAQDNIINVTEDVSLWYTGAAKNHGWMLTVEDPGVYVQLVSPTDTIYMPSWRLRITYEPE